MIPSSFTRGDLMDLAERAKKIFSREPTLLVLKRQLIRVVGDIHGDVESLRTIIQLIDQDPNCTYVFLGDYGDRGENSVGVYAILLWLKCNFPKRVYLLRGNHEDESQSKKCGFRDESRAKGFLDFYNAVVELFPFLPLAALLNGKVLCAHGGIPSGDVSLRDIQSVERTSAASIPREGIICELTWNDPSEEVEDFSPNTIRKKGNYFGCAAFERFMASNGLDVFIRGHQDPSDGYSVNFSGKKVCVTIFSSSNYMGKHNRACIADVNEDGKVDAKHIDCL